jgi:hypothetical protein
MEADSSALDVVVCFIICRNRDVNKENYIPAILHLLQYHLHQRTWLLPAQTARLMAQSASLTAFQLLRLVVSRKTSKNESISDA